MGRTRPARRVERHHDHAARAPDEPGQGVPDRGRGEGPRGAGGQAQRDRRAAASRRSRHLQPDLVRPGLTAGAVAAHVAHRGSEGRAHSVHARRARSASASRMRTTARGRAASGPTSTPASGASPTACRSTTAATTTTIRSSRPPRSSPSSARCSAIGGRSSSTAGRAPASRNGSGSRSAAGRATRSSSRPTDFADKGHVLVGRRVARLAADAEAGGAVHARGRRDHRLPVHDGRSGHVHAPVDGRVPAVANQAKQGVTVGRLYEYACHEGNYALPNTMKGWLAEHPDDAPLARRARCGSIRRWLRTRRRRSRRSTSGSKRCCRRSTRTRTKRCSPCRCDRPASSTRPTAASPGTRCGGASATWRWPAVRRTRARCSGRARGATSTPTSIATTRRPTKSAAASGS